MVARYKANRYIQPMDIFKIVQTTPGPLGNHEYWVGNQMFEQKHVCILGDILYVSGNGIRKPADVESCTVDNDSCFLWSNVQRHIKQLFIFAYPQMTYAEAFDYFIETGIIVVLESSAERFAKTGQRERLYAFNMEKEGVVELCKVAVKQKISTPIM